MITEMQNGVEIPIVLSEMQGGAEVLVDTATEMQDGAEVTVYSAFDAKVHNINSGIAGINADGSIYVNQGSAITSQVIIPVAVITLKSAITLPSSGQCGSIKSMSADIIVDGGSGSISVQSWLENTSFSQRYASGSLSDPIFGVSRFSGDVTISSWHDPGAQGSVTSNQFGFQIIITGGSGGDFDKYLVSAPAGCLTICGKQLRKIKLI